MTLLRRVARLEVELPAPEVKLPPVEWLVAMTEAMETVLATMPEHRAERAFELIEAGDWPWDPIARRVVDLALAAAPPAEPEWWPPEVRPWATVREPHVEPLALPEGACRVIDEHPDATFRWYGCVRCDYRPGEASWRGADCRGHTHARPALGRALFERCPLCDGPVEMLGIGWKRPTRTERSTT